MVVGTGVFYLNDKTFKFNEGDTLDIGTVKTGDIFKIEINPKPFKPEPGFEDQVNTDLDELSYGVDNLTYTISGKIYTWSQAIDLDDNVEEPKPTYFIGALDVNDGKIIFVNLKLTI